MLSWQWLDIVASDETINTKAMIVRNLPDALKTACCTSDGSAEGTGGVVIGLRE
jgi:hypothetical protein